MYVAHSSRAHTPICTLMMRRANIIADAKSTSTGTGCDRGSCQECQANEQQAQLRQPNRAFGAGHSQLHVYREGSTTKLRASLRFRVAGGNWQEYTEVVIDRHFLLTVPLSGATAKTPCLIAFVELAVYLDWVMTAISAVRANGWSVRTRAALECVELRFSEPSFSLSQLSGRLRVSPFHLSRLIKRETGHGFREHLSQARMVLARRELRNKILSVKEIAAHAGYNSTTSFDREFKRIHGCSPTEWRRQTE